MDPKRKTEHHGDSPAAKRGRALSPTLYPANFVYFGFKFIQADFSVPDTVEDVSLTYFNTTLWSDFIDGIAEDMALLNKGCFGGKTVAEKNDDGFNEWEANGFFTRGKRSRNSFYYNHTYHATFSAITLSQITRLVSLPLPKNVAHDECTTHTDHYNLMPFFMDNIGLELVYEKQLRRLGGQLSAERKRFLEDALIKLRVNSVANTPYDYHTSREDAWDYQEDDWTKRLKFSLDDTYSDLEIILTSEKKAISVNPTALDVFEPVEVYPLRGAPDMIFRMMKAVVVRFGARR